MIQLDHVYRSYGTGEKTVAAVRDVTLAIDAGSFVSIVGASGSGKSTLLNLIGGLDRPTEGRVVVDKRELGRLSDAERTLLRRTRIGFVFQFFNLLPTLTALENVALPARLARQSRKLTGKRAQELLERVGLSRRGHHRPDELSGGEMQRVAIARALMMDPPILLADEPTGNLDSSTGVAILDLLRGAVDKHRTVVLITHDAKVAQRGQRIITMADGRLLRDEVVQASLRPVTSV
ncbi:MAG: ABC transporter ATP-binding protein [Polyangiales bacterium]